MRKLYIFGLVALAALIIGLAWAEQITLTTYYPAPYGVYKTMRLYPHDDFTPGDVCTNDGELYYDASDDRVYVCINSSWQTWAAGGATYDSGWFNIGNGANQLLTHNLGKTSMSISVYAADDSVGTNMTTVSYAVREADSGNKYGASVQNITNTNFSFYTGHNGYRIFTAAGHSNKNWAYARVLADTE